jgi:hypothetical protein
MVYLLERSVTLSTCWSPVSFTICAIETELIGRVYQMQRLRPSYLFCRPILIVVGENLMVYKPFSEFRSKFIDHPLTFQLA